MPSGDQFLNTGVRILVGVICIFGCQQVEQFEIGSICYLVEDSLEGLCHSGHCNQQKLFKG
jgi:hypothetical protein